MEDGKAMLYPLSSILHPRFWQVIQPDPDLVDQAFVQPQLARDLAGGGAAAFALIAQHTQARGNIGLTRQFIIRNECSVGGTNRHGAELTAGRGPTTPLDYQGELAARPVGAKMPERL